MQTARRMEVHSWLPRMQDADQREQPAGRIHVDLNFIDQTITQQFSAFIVQAAARHIDGFDLRRCHGLDGVKIAFADHEAIFDDTAK